MIAAAGASLWVAPAFAAADPFGAIEARVGGRLGVAALDVKSGQRLGYRADERFPMCSTFKAMAVAAVLKRVDAGAEHLGRFVRYTKADMQPYGPTTSLHVSEGGMTLEALLEAAIKYSDNTAANLILKALGGPSSWTTFVRSLGDATSRLDRNEPGLNTSIPGDPRDTTTPAAMVADLNATLIGNALSQASRYKLADWMVECATGTNRLRAGLPGGGAWRIGDKTGTGDHASTNDIAAAWTPTGPIVIACYFTGAEAASPSAREAAIADVGRVIAASFRPHG
jgi:beta-lactamase class A